MKMKHALLGIAAMLIFAAANANSQTVSLAIMGSSAQFLEIGQASWSNSNGCSFTFGSNGVTATDTRVTISGSNPTESGNVWITWTLGGGANCGSPGASSTINLYLSTDSVLGNRCFFAAQSGSTGCSLSTTLTTSSAPSNLLGASTFPDQTSIPQSIINAINAGVHVNVAATDIRPEDAIFATFRALSPCGQQIGTSNYYGLGYQTTTNVNVGNSIVQAPFVQTQIGAATNTSFHVINFAITGKDPVTGVTVPSFSVVPVGAVPVVVFVNPGDTAGFGSLQIQNVNRAQLAGYLDGTYGRTYDMVPELASAAGTAVGSITFVREPASGTYNVMEYSIPNDASNLSSQDVGFQSVNSATGLPGLNCSGSGSTAVVASNPLSETVTRGSASSSRYRAIGTGNMVKAVLATEDSLGYAFWSAGNFSGASAAKAKYLTVDGVDPIQETWSDGLVPTTNNGLLGNVTLSHVKDGSYPIWSQLRMVTTPALRSTLQTLITNAANFLSPTQPDFVPPNALEVVRSHFAPPGITFPSSAGANSPCNGTNAGCAEAGGDVAGMVYTILQDESYNTDAGTNTGNINHRQ